MSRKALEGIEPQTCLDDLESFLYVLVYIALRDTGTVSPGENFPSPLDNWGYPTASMSKFGFLFTRFDYAIDRRLGKPFQTLVERLHSVFRNIVIQAIRADSTDEPPPIVDQEEIYDMMLTHVCDAIEDLNQELQEGISTPCDSGRDVDTKEAPFDDTSWVDKPKMPRKIVRTLATNSARRSRASLPMTNTVRSRETLPLFIFPQWSRHTP